AARMAAPTRCLIALPPSQAIPASIVLIFYPKRRAFLLRVNTPCLPVCTVNTCALYPSFESEGANMANHTSSRRRFLQDGIAFGAASVLAVSILPREADAQTNPGPPPSEPSGTTWIATIVPPGEPGDPMIVSGRVFAPDASRAIPGVVVYAYNTDKDGY